MDIVIECFKEFAKKRFDRYCLGKKFYPNGPFPGDQNGQNPYFKTEADVQVKFGGYLEGWLIDNYPQLAVHAELPVYNSSHQRADLSIHRLVNNEFWVSRENIFDTLESVIEIKLANVREPYYDFLKGGINKDLHLLKSVPPHIRRYLVIIDEAELIESNKIGQFIKEANSFDIKIVSNNVNLQI